MPASLTARIMYSVNKRYPFFYWCRGTLETFFVWTFYNLKLKLFAKRCLQDLKTSNFLNKLPGTDSWQEHSLQSFLALSFVGSKLKIQSPLLSESTSGIVGVLLIISLHTCVAICIFNNRFPSLLFILMYSGAYELVLTSGPMTVLWGRNEIVNWWHLKCITFSTSW